MKAFAQQVCISHPPMGLPEISELKSRGGPFLQGKIRPLSQKKLLEGGAISPLPLVEYTDLYNFLPIPAALAEAFLVHIFQYVDNESQRLPEDSVELLMFAYTLVFTLGG